jgi:hypothetical protein
VSKQKHEFSNQMKKKEELNIKAFKNNKANSKKQVSEKRKRREERQLHLCTYRCIDQRARAAAEGRAPS